ncbi:hypothetical protein L596_030159 [Steinernema carpocapsae]|uniref:C-type lectin domain-containing protein n=1 Tax=Steinernema carpocapsae TaxID=34508 RepID=A0A4U5LRW4_STECR|nr:hypothetical protein L596_030159 [Steinernema carpocapsae]
MRTTSLLAFVAVLAPLAWAQLCPNNAVSSADNSKCFQFLALKSNFLAAEQTCRALGGHLASVYNAADVDIVNRGAQQFFKGPGRELYWVGGTNMNTNFEIWQWTDGEPFRYRNWAKPEDNNPLLFNKNCVAVERSNGTWVPDQCCLLKPFVCEAPVIVPPTCPRKFKFKKPNKLRILSLGDFV